MYDQYCCVDYCIVYAYFECQIQNNNFKYLNNRF